MINLNIPRKLIFKNSVGEALTVVILGSLCGLRNVSQINQWSEDQRVMDFLLKLIEPSSMNQWRGYRLMAIDGPSVRLPSDDALC